MQDNLRVTKYSPHPIYQTKSYFKIHLHEVLPSFTIRSATSKRIPEIQEDMQDRSSIMSQQHDRVLKGLNGNLPFMVIPTDNFSGHSKQVLRYVDLMSFETGCFMKRSILWAILGVRFDTFVLLCSPEF